MSAEVLRRASALMRERAEAIEIPWHPHSDEDLPERSTPQDFMHDMQGYLGGAWGDHAGSWHPAVALAVADWLTWCAQYDAFNGRALTVARTYLGEQS